MKHVLIVLAGVSLVSPMAFAGPTADEMRQCVIDKVGGHEAFGAVAAAPVPHHPTVRPNGSVDLGYGHRRPQPFSFTTQPTVTHEALRHAASQCEHELGSQ